MFKGLISLVLVLGVQFVHAARLVPPCGASVMNMSCLKDFTVTRADGSKVIQKVTYSIEVTTPSSAKCTNLEGAGSRTAEVNIYTQEDGLIGNLKLSHGSFVSSYKNGKATFAAPLVGLKLNNCEMPLNGGFSIGN